MSTVAEEAERIAHNYGLSLDAGIIQAMASALRRAHAAGLREGAEMATTYHLDEAGINYAVLARFVGRRLSEQMLVRAATLDRRREV